MEITPMLSPLSLGAVPYYEALRRFPKSAAEAAAEAEDLPCLPPQPELNFRIDDLLDFSNESACQAQEDEEEEEEEEEEREVGSNCSTFSEVQVRASPTTTTSKKKDTIASSLQTIPNYSQYEASHSGLCVPPDELADQLEWLSAFNEDSSYSGDRQLASLVSTKSLRSSKEDEEEELEYRRAMAGVQDRFQSPSPISVLEMNGGFSYLSNRGHHVPSRARSKRSRSGGRVWSLDTLIPTLVDNTLIQDSPFFHPYQNHPYSSYSSSSLSSSSSSGLLSDSRAFFLPSSSSTAMATYSAKKAKKASHQNPSSSSSSPSTTVSGMFKTVSAITIAEAPSRRCSHCLVTKTPQWRAGPNGPKTLCNACGVRYKSGRLVPEYRPAGSPTFVSEVHSNSHRRILEMRRMKEVEEQIKEGDVDDDDHNDGEEEIDDGDEGDDGRSQVTESCKDPVDVELCTSSLCEGNSLANTKTTQSLDKDKNSCGDHPGSSKKRIMSIPTDAIKKREEDREGHDSSVEAEESMQESISSV